MTPDELSEIEELAEVAGYISEENVRGALRNRNRLLKELVAAVRDRDSEIERLKAKLCRAYRSNPPFVTELRPGPYLERCSICGDWHSGGRHARFVYHQRSETVTKDSSQ